MLSFGILFVLTSAPPNEGGTVRRRYCCVCHTSLSLPQTHACSPRVTGRAPWV